MARSGSGVAKEPTFAVAALPDRRAARRALRAADRVATRRRSVGTTCSRAGSSPIALEGSYAKFLRGQSDKPIHEFFGMQADLLLESAEHIIENGATP